MKYLALVTMFAIISTMTIMSSNAAELSSPPDTSRQLILVITPSWNSHKARVNRFERSGKDWQMVSGHYEAVVGSKGLAWGIGYQGESDADPRKKEGDRKAPAGMFRLVKAMGYASTPATYFTFPYEQIRDDSYCVDDKDSHYYNRIVNGPDLPAPTTNVWKSAEVMKRKDDLYKWLVLVDYNIKNRHPGAGSCIFIHVWRSAEKGTAGCTAMAEKDLLALITWLNNDADPILVQLPQEAYETYWRQWKLPAPAVLDR